MDGVGGQAAFALEQPLAADAVFGGRAMYGAAGTPKAEAQNSSGKRLAASGGSGDGG